MQCEDFQSFRLVGGTALGLQLGHRLSIDIDLFSAAEYGSLDFEAIHQTLTKHFLYVSDVGNLPISMGKSFFVGDSEKSAIKLDCYYTDPFIEEPINKDGIRLASINEIIAMKMDVISRAGRMKDFWDIHELIDHFQFETMVKLHQKRYPFGHDISQLTYKIIDFSNAEDDLEPICLKGKFWEMIKEDIRLWSTK